MTDDSVLDRPDWALDTTAAAERCQAFIRESLDRSGLDGLVVGLSGGIDSAVSAGLAVKALGPERVRGICLPYRTSNPSSLTDGRAVADVLGMPSETVDITSMVDALLAMRPGAEADPVRCGNVMARARMIVLYDASAAWRSLVLGTGNRTEWLLGYTTLHGDAACGLNPIAQLYKTEIRLMSEHLGLPSVLLTKAPSADLWEGQSDEDELGFTYADADRLLHHLVDEGLAPRQLASLGFSADLVERVTTRMRSQSFKRVLPPECEFGRPGPDAA